LVDKPETQTESNQPSQDNETGKSRVVSPARSTPTPTSQSKTQKASEASIYGKRTVGILVTIGGVILVGWRAGWRNLWEFLDRHNGSISALATVAIVILTVFYVTYSKRQWETMRGQLEQMEKQLPELRKAADAATESANLTRQQLIGSQAANVSVRFDVIYRFLPGEAHGLRSIVDYRSGTVMASDIHVSIDASWKDSRDLKDIGVPQHFDFTVPQLRFDNPRNTFNMVPLDGLNAETWESIGQTSKPKTIAVKGIFRYNNGFAQVPDQPFCFIWFAHPEVLGNSANNFVDCAQYKSLLVMFEGFDKKTANTKAQ
jgi:hypothetical protein